MSVDYDIPTTWDDNTLDWSDCENPNGKPPRNAPLLPYMEAIYRAFIERYEGKYGQGAWVAEAIPVNAAWWTSLTAKSNSDIKYFPMLKLAQAIHAEVVHAAASYNTIPNSVYSRTSRSCRYYDSSASPLYAHYIQHDDLGLPATLNLWDSASMLAAIGDTAFIEPKRETLLRGWIGQMYRILNQLRICWWHPAENNDWATQTGLQLKITMVNGTLAPDWENRSKGLGPDYGIGILKSNNVQPWEEKCRQVRGYLCFSYTPYSGGTPNSGFNRTIPWCGVKQVMDMGEDPSNDNSYGYVLGYQYLSDWVTANVSTQDVYRLSGIIQLDYNGIPNSYCVIDDGSVLADYRVASPDGFGFRNW